MQRSNDASKLLSNLIEFGTNPGSLRSLTHIPENLPDGAPLVIVLHGCEQTATDYDRGSGWSDLADRHEFALLFPEQRRSNNWLWRSAVATIAPFGDLLAITPSGILGPV